MNWDLVIGVGVVVLAVVGYLATRSIRGRQRRDRLRALRDPDSAESLEETHRSNKHGDSWSTMGL